MPGHIKFEMRLARLVDIDVAARSESVARPREPDSEAVYQGHFPFWWCPSAPSVVIDAK